MTATTPPTRTPLPGASPGFGPQILNLVLDPDRALWFTVSAQDEIGRLALFAPTCIDMIGATLSKAKLELRAAGCRVGKVSFVRRRRHRRGTVVPRRPRGGRPVPQGSKVALKVAR